MPSEHSGTAVDVQPKPDRYACGFPIVGIGASAGGLAVFEVFFSGMPPGRDMAFLNGTLQPPEPASSGAITGRDDWQTSRPVSFTGSAWLLRLVMLTRAGKRPRDPGAVKNDE